MSSAPSTSRAAALAVSAWIALGLWGCPWLNAEEPEDCMPVGALLPFTGDLASAGANIERALMLALEDIEAAGGVGPRPLCLVPRDTHSDEKRGLAAARDLLRYQRVRALFGPQQDGLALRVIEELRRARVAGISGGTTSPTQRFTEDNGLWFRTVPSALVLGEALAERMYQDGARHISVLYESSEYGVGWSSVLQVNFTARGGTSEGIFSYQPDQQTYTEVLNRAFAPGVDAVVLVASARSGAAIVEEWASSGRGGAWYFTPSLNDRVFLDNIPLGTVDGMIGISPAVGADADRFTSSFAARWAGERPLRDAYFYYDAAVLWALAYETARSQPGGAPAAEGIARQIQPVSAPPGQLVHWYELDRALDLVRAGEEIDYIGASGDVNIDSRGDVESGRYQFWSVVEDRVELED